MPALSMQVHIARWPGIKRLDEFMASLANEAYICIAVIAVRGGDIRGGFAGSGSRAEAEEGASQGHLLCCIGRVCWTRAGRMPAPIVLQPCSNRLHGECRFGQGCHSRVPVWLRGSRRGRLCTSPARIDSKVLNLRTIPEGLRSAPLKA